MTEATEQLGARTAEGDDRRVPADYGDAAAEYAVVREGGAGLSDFSARGRIEVSGSEAVQFLNGLITNDVKALEEGAWMRAAFPNVQGGSSLRRASCASARTGSSSTRSRRRASAC